MKHEPLHDLVHRAHDYGHLISRWRRVARANGLRMEPFARAGKYSLYCVRTPERFSREGGLYVSAGIHGDEPAAPDALALWGETRLPVLMRRRRPPPLMILPCLNPWGLVNNRRTDARDRDLNRLFNRTDVSPIREFRRLLTGWRFAFALSLHEDYDARGIYGYELHARPPDWGAQILQACADLIPIDPRTRIETRAFANGLLLRRRGLHRIPLHPENIYLHLQNHCVHSLTFETPSEFSLGKRVETHVQVIDECVKRIAV